MFLQNNDQVVPADRNPARLEPATSPGEPSNKSGSTTDLCQLSFHHSQLASTSSTRRARRRTAAARGDGGGPRRPGGGGGAKKRSKSGRSLELQPEVTRSHIIPGLSRNCHLRVEQLFATIATSEPQHQQLNIVTTSATSAATPRALPILWAHITMLPLTCQ